MLSWYAAELTYYVGANLATGNIVHSNHFGELKLRVGKERRGGCADGLRFEVVPV